MICTASDYIPLSPVFITLAFSNLKWLKSPFVSSETFFRVIGGNGALDDDMLTVDHWGVDDPFKWRCHVPRGVKPQISHLHEEAFDERREAKWLRDRLRRREGRSWSNSIRRLRIQS
jgi:hypothetical protein